MVRLLYSNLQYYNRKQLFQIVVIFHNITFFCILDQINAVSCRINGTLAILCNFLFLDQCERGLMGVVFMSEIVL